MVFKPFLGGSHPYPRCGTRQGHLCSTEEINAVVQRWPRGSEKNKQRSPTTSGKQRPGRSERRTSQFRWEKMMISDGRLMKKWWVPVPVNHPRSITCSSWFFTMLRQCPVLLYMFALETAINWRYSGAAHFQTHPEVGPEDSRHKLQVEYWSNATGSLVLFMESSIPNGSLEYHILGNEHPEIPSYFGVETKPHSPPSARIGRA